LLNPITHIRPPSCIVQSSWFVKWHVFFWKEWTTRKSNIQVHIISLAKVTDWMNQIRMAGCPIVVIKQDILPPNVVGHYDPLNHIISINQAVTDDRLIQKTIVHELVHAYEFDPINY
jgi:hypothetical protein